MKELEELEIECLKQTGRYDLCPTVARVLAEIAERCQVRVKRLVVTLPCHLLRSATVAVFMARDGAVATIKLHEDFYLVVEIGGRGRCHII